MLDAALGRRVRAGRGLATRSRAIRAGRAEARANGNVQPTSRQNVIVTESQDVIDIALTADERYLLNRGLVEWGGPARCTEAMAVAMGFEDVDNLLTDGHRIARELSASRPLTRRDWTRALLSTEVAFASDVLGSGVDWQTTTGLDDVSTIKLLRGLQRRLVGVYSRPPA